MPIYTQGCGTGVAFDQDLNTTDSVAFAALTVAGAAAVVTTDSRLSDARTPTAHTHPLSDLTQSSATAGQVPSWNGTAWTPSTPTVTTDASLLTSGTLADARLSANVSLDDINNNFSASQTFAGSANTAPNQTAASGASLMTRDLVDRRLEAGGPQFHRIDLSTSGNISNGGGANPRSGNSFIDLSFWATPVAGTTATTFTQSFLPAIISDNDSGVPSGYGIINMAKSHILTATFFFNTTNTTDIIARIGLGACAISSGVLGVIIQNSGYYFRIWRNNSTTWNGALQCRTLQFNNSAITGATNASPIVITVNGDHNLATGNEVEITNVGGNTAANNMWTVTVLSARTFSLNGSTGNGVYTSGGSFVKQSPTFQFTSGRIRKLFLVSNGTGTVSLYFGSVSGSPLATISGMATSYAGSSLFGSQITPFNAGVRSVTDNTAYNGMGLGNLGFIV
jgi:hypothetical protein